MNDFKQVILDQQKRYPKMLLVDLVKLIFQNEFGNGHFIANEEASLARLQEEFAGVEKGKGGLFEPIGNGLTRLNLKALAGTLPLTIVNRFFVLTAQSVRGSVQGFEKKLQVLKDLCQEGVLPHDPEKLANYLETYRKAGYPPVSHSQVYGESYNPSYRVLKSDFALYFPVFEAIEKLLQEKEAMVLAIDGPSGSGKSTLAQLIWDVYSCPVISMDHFFLQPHQRTSKRFQEPGGNVDYERFKIEVTAKLKAEPFTYRIYNCQDGSFSTSADIKPHRLIVLEGSYSHHPALAENYDLKVFLKISEKLQQERILKRNGSSMLERFVKEWIPLEEDYFRILKIEAGSDLVLRTE